MINMDILGQNSVDKCAKLSALPEHLDHFD